MIAQDKSSNKFPFCLSEKKQMYNGFRRFMERGRFYV
jgi:hypothetical protein